MKETIKINDIEYRTHDAFTFGDYGGYGSCGLSNIEHIIENHKEHVIQSSYSCIHDIEVTGGRYLGKELIEEVIEENPEVIDVYGGWSSRTVYIRADVDDEQEYTKDAENYPCLSEERMSEVEIEWENEAWNSWLKHDLIRTLPDELEDKVNDMSNDDLFRLYRKAMEDCNEYPITEYSDVYIRVEEISERFKELLIEFLEKKENN